MFPVEIKQTENRGRGVFATKDFIAGEIIEICPVLILNEQEAKNYENTILGNYLYEWESEEDGAIILGYGLIYNHSYTPNAEYIRNFPDKTMTYQAVKDIKKGEEILINYNGHPTCDDPIDWFEVK